MTTLENNTKIFIILADGEIYCVCSSKEVAEQIIETDKKTIDILKFAESIIIDDSNRFFDSVET